MSRSSPTIAVVLAVAVLLGVGAAGAAGPAIARPNPLQSTVEVGDTFVVDLYLQDIVDAYGADIRMCFNPAIIQVQDANPGIPGIQIQPLSTFMQPGFVIKQDAFNAPDETRDACKTAGLVWYAFTQLNPAEPKSGSGPIAAVTFKAVQNGTTTLKIEYQKASDRNGIEIPTTYQNGSVRVGPVVFMHQLLLPMIQR